MADRFELRLRAGLLDLIEGAPGEHPRWTTSPAADRITAIAGVDRRLPDRLAGRVGLIRVRRRPGGALAWLAILAMLLALLGVALLASGGRTDRGLVLVPTPSPGLSRTVLLKPFLADSTGDVRAEPIDGSSSPTVGLTQPPVSPAIDITSVRATVGLDTVTIDVALAGQAGPEEYVVLVALFPATGSPYNGVVEMAISCDRAAACRPAPSTIFFEPVAFTYSMRAADGERVASFVVVVDELVEASRAWSWGQRSYALEVHTWLRAPLPEGWWFEDVAPENGSVVPIPVGEAL